jgi:hypothetical protein
LNGRAAEQSTDGAAEARVVRIMGSGSGEDAGRSGRSAPLKVSAGTIAGGFQKTRDAIVCRRIGV